MFTGWPIVSVTRRQSDPGNFEPLRAPSSGLNYKCSAINYL
jgi:hypothetical protein